jgi:hypothetical protein
MPSAKYEEGKPVYEITDDGPKFVRKFKSLFPGSLTKPFDFDLSMSADPSQQMRFQDSSVRTIIKSGEMQTAEWDLYPTLERRWFRDSEADVTLRGTILEFKDSTSRYTGIASGAWYWSI